MQIRVQKGHYQERFLFSKSKFPCLKASIGSGKTLCLLVKIFNYCEDYPGTTALIVRKEFTDLKDSTMRDFEKYFSVKIGSDKDYTFPNKSKLMFRHAAEIEVLKNINLGIAGIEQAEEFEDDTQFQFIRDRLRQQNGADVRPLCIIANANGHNWVYKLWLQGAEIQEIDRATGQFCYKKGEYECLTANSFANEKNLPPDFIADLRRMELEAPNHYKQYILNSDEETDADDLVFTFSELERVRILDYGLRESYGLRIIGFDIARYGNDKCAAVCIQQMGALHWKVCHVEQWEKKDLDYTTGRILSIRANLNSNKNVIDEDGIGAGPLDTITKGQKRDDFIGFRNPGLSYNDSKFYGNKRTENAFKLKDLISKGHIGLTDEELMQELSTLKYKYMNDGRKILISKEEMRKEGVKSPNLADALIMAVSLIGEIKYNQDRQYITTPAYSKEDNLFSLGGIK